MTEEKAAPKDFLGIKTKRESLGMTLKDVFALTRISVVNLEAIENGNFPELPVPIYTKNFIRTYARALDLDSQPILDSYRDYLNSQQGAQTPPPKVVPEKEQEPFGERLSRYKTYVVVAVIIIIFAGAAVIIYQQYQLVPDVAVKPQTAIEPAQPVAVNPSLQPVEQSQTAQALPATPPRQPVGPSLSQQVQAPSVAAQPALPAKQSAAQVKSPLKQNVNVPAIVPVVGKKEPVAVSKEMDTIVIKATEETWLRMKVDQNPAFQVLLKPGEQIVRKGAGFEVDIGNAGGITMQFNGKVIENLGNSGQVIHMRLPE